MASKLSRKWFEGFASAVALLTAVAGGLLLIAVGLDWVATQPWGLRGFVMLAGGSSSFYGFGCFRIWPGDEPTGKSRSPLWFIHQYWLNALGCATGWVAFFILLRKYGDGRTTSVAAGDILLALVAFLGLIGHLPWMATGVAVAIREIAKKVLEKVV